MSDALPTLNPNALSDIFEKSGEDLTDGDLNTLISRFRSERVTMLAEETAGKSKKKSEISKEVSLSKKAVGGWTLSCFPLPFCEAPDAISSEEVFFCASEQPVWFVRPSLPKLPIFYAKGKQPEQR